jgi:hypothetical protein
VGALWAARLPPCWTSEDGAAAGGGAPVCGDGELVAGVAARGAEGVAKLRAGELGADAVAPTARAGGRLGRVDLRWARAAGRGLAVAACRIGLGAGVDGATATGVRAR